MVPANGIFTNVVYVARIRLSGIDTDETLQAPVLGRVAGDVSGQHCQKRTNSRRALTARSPRLFVLVLIMNVEHILAHTIPPQKR